MEHAETTDLEFLAALVRRIDPARLTVVVCSGAGPIPDDELVAVLSARAELVDAAAVDGGDGARPRGPRPRPGGAGLRRLGRRQ